MEKELIDQLVQEALERTVSLCQAGEDGQAEMLCRQILCVDPDQVSALQMLGLIESKQRERRESGLTNLLKALELDPKNPEVHNSIGLVYTWADVNDGQKAEHHFREAIALQPDNMVSRSNLGIFLKGQRRLQEAEHVFRDALAIDPNNAAVNFNFATLLGELHRWDEAESYYRITIRLDPNNAMAHHNLSHLLLYQGRCEEGWKEYEWRWDTYPRFKKIYERFLEGDDPKPFWRGESLAGRTILLYAEQGMGDSIQFVRFCPALKAMGATVVVEEHADLVPIFRGAPGVDRTVVLGVDALPPFDYHCSLVSLANILGIHDLETQLPTAPYLKTDYVALSDLSILDESNWASYGSAFRIGIVWAGNPVHSNDHIRSTRLSNFKSLLLPGVKLFSLQKDTRARFWPGRGEVDLTEGSEGMGVVDLKDFLLDYNNTAALIDRMDLLVTVDTSTAHLAAAMGKEVWLLVAWHNDWRWMEHRSDTPWYPTMRIFRQPVPDDWDSVFAEVRMALSARLGVTRPVG
jgi:tetratricopeptide (TPR) repeat protein